MYTIQLLHSTVEVCWNINDSYFIWFKFVCRNSGQIASRRSWKRSCLGLEYTCGVDIVRNDMYSERCVSLVFLFWGEVGKFRSSRVVPRERVGSPKSESRRVKLLRDGCACGARVNLGMRNVRRVPLTDTWSWYRVTLRVGDLLGSV